MTDLNRRDFARAAGVATALGYSRIAGANNQGRTGSGYSGDRQSPHAKLRSLRMNEVRWRRGFWAQRFETDQTAILPTIWRALNDPKNGESYRNFLVAAGLEKGWFAHTDWNDGDVYKYVEALAHIYALTREPGLDRHMDEMIAVFAKVQEPDGYISTPVKLKHLGRWTSLYHHELYNMGHLMTAAAVHYRATGKTNFLRIARKVGDYLYPVFQPRPPKLAHFGFNPSNIMGAVDLYHVTGEAKYLELAGIFIDMRGSASGGTDENQDRIPLRKETEAAGHAVTANYLYSGAADVYAETGDPTLLQALERIWENATTQKIYVTGAVGNLFRGEYRWHDYIYEAYGIPYELPNRLGYNETCANIANAMWNRRMLTLTGEAKYADVMELVLYNSMLSGVGVAGRGFFYNNPLRRYGRELPQLMRPRDPIQRSPILPCYCCPPNVARTIARLHEWAYNTTGDALWVNLYGGNEVDTSLGGSKLKLTQTTRYPWDGHIKFDFLATPEKEFALMLRIPGWAEGALVTVNGATVRSNLSGPRYTEVRRAWTKGDTLEIDFPMKPRLVVANPYVEAARNQVAVMRGPIVYALESPDLPAGVRITEVALPARIKLTPRHDEKLLGGVTVLEGRARLIPGGGRTGTLYETLRPEGERYTDIKLIPYYAWANRGVSYMTVWMPVVW